VAELAYARDDPMRSSQLGEALARRTQQLAVARREIATLKREIATLRSKQDAAGAR
jgi:cell division protein FtsB